jgi:hypothetical protein
MQKVDITYLVLSFIPLWGAMLAVMLAALFKVSARLLLLLSLILTLPVGCVSVDTYMRDGREYWGDNPGVGIALIVLLLCWGSCLVGTLIYALVVKTRR